MTTRSTDILVVTTNEVADKKITQYLGMVHGIVVRTPTWGQGFTGALKGFIGGKNSAYTEMCEQTRDHAYQNMLEDARRLGANAIIATRYDSDSVGTKNTTANEVFCYGTAVILK